MSRLFPLGPDQNHLGFVLYEVPRAGKWATQVFKWEEDNKGHSKFLDWDEFQMDFRKDFCPLHSDTVAITTLESDSYFQGNCSVDDYLNEFKDLITDAGYTDSKTTIVKFRKGLDSEIQDAIATMAYGRPSDSSLSSWYEAAKNIDQNRAAKTAFNSACQSSIPVVPCHILPTPILNPTPIAHKDIDSPLKMDIRILAQGVDGKEGHNAKEVSNTKETCESHTVVCFSKPL